MNVLGMWLAWAAALLAAQQAQSPAPLGPRGFLDQYCVSCHSGNAVTGAVPIRQWIDEIDPDLSNISGKAKFGKT